jgi:DNA polymerase-4
MQSKILHIDMDAFYASVEQRDNPELQGKPIIVGGSKRGVVSTASYEARKFGIHSAMPVFTALKKCPQAILVPVRMGAYKEASMKVMRILRDFSPVIDQISVDEAFIDISGTERLWNTDLEIVRAIKKRILEETDLTCSIGIAPVRFLAKICSDMNKPDGHFILSPEAVTEFLTRLPIEKIPGIGPKSMQKIRVLGVRFASDILKFSEEFWIKKLGKAGKILFERAQGNGATHLIPDVKSKSFGAEDTLLKDTMDRTFLKSWLLHQSERIGEDLRKSNFEARTVILKIKYSDFKTITRSHTLSMPTAVVMEIYQIAQDLMAKLNFPKPVRLIGVTATNLIEAGKQLELFPDENHEKSKKIDKTLDEVRAKFGRGSLVRGRIADFVRPRDK